MESYSEKVDRRRERKFIVAALSTQFSVLSPQFSVLSSQH